MPSCPLLLYSLHPVLLRYSVYSAAFQWLQQQPPLFFFFPFLFPYSAYYSTQTVFIQFEENCHLVANDRGLESEDTSQDTDDLSDRDHSVAGSASEGRSTGSSSSSLAGASSTTFFAGTARARARARAGAGAGARVGAGVTGAIGLRASLG